MNAPAIVAHNAHVDVDVLRRELRGWETPEVFDTLKLARRLVPGQRSYKLGALVDGLQAGRGVAGRSVSPPGRATTRWSRPGCLWSWPARREQPGRTTRRLPGGEDEPAALF